MRFIFTYFLKLLRSLFSLFFIFLLLLSFINCGGGSGNSSDDVTLPDYSIRPIVFVHGFMGSASQFESQAQRFIANGYNHEWIYAYEHNTTSNDALTILTQVSELYNFITQVLETTGADKVNLISHSRGGFICTYYLKNSTYASKIARYVHIDSTSMLTPAKGVPTLALWGEPGLLSPDEVNISGATNIHFSDQSHVQVCTSKESFIEMYKFFHNEEPFNTEIPVLNNTTVTIAGRVLYFQENTGAIGTLKIYKTVNGQRSGEAVETFNLVESTKGNWGPLEIENGGTYEFEFTHSTGTKHLFYKEAFSNNNYFIRLLTGNPSKQGLSDLMPKTDDHSNVIIMRDKELWGDQDENNDILNVTFNSNSYNVITKEAAARSHRLIALFLMDWGSDKSSSTTTPDKSTDLSEPIQVFHTYSQGGDPTRAAVFLSGLDLYMPASGDGNGTITFELTPRGGNGKKQTIKVPNWQSTNATISVLFNDYVQ